MIESWQMSEALRPRLGSALADDPGICGAAVSLLQSYAPYRDTFASVASRMETVLFNALYERLGPAMSARMDNGVSRRIRMNELPELADDAMGVLFNSLRVYSVNYEALHAYCMETGSFSGFRALCTRFGELCPPEERRIIARMIRGSYPPARWESWLKEE